MIKAFLLAFLINPAIVGPLPVQVHVMSPDEINAAFNAGHEGEEKRVGGWAVFAEDLSWCRVYVPPLTWDTLGIWTHEFRHCREGSFHD